MYSFLRNLSFDYFFDENKNKNVNKIVVELMETSFYF